MQRRRRSNASEIYSRNFRRRKHQPGESFDEPKSATFALLTASRRTFETRSLKPSWRVIRLRIFGRWRTWHQPQPSPNPKVRKLPKDVLRWLDPLPSQAQQSKRYAKVRISPPHPKHAQVVALTSIRAAEGNALRSTRHATCARKLDTLPRCVGGGKLNSTPSNPPHSPTGVIVCFSGHLSKCLHRDGCWYVIVAGESPCTIANLQSKIKILWSRCHLWDLCNLQDW